MNHHNMQPTINRESSALNLMHHLRNSYYWYLLLMVMLGIIAVYYRLQWGSFARFVKAIDHYTGFMLDFGIYYSMSKQILALPTPVAGYYYTAFFALVLTPLSALKLSSALVVWEAIQYACVAAMCFIAARLLTLPPPGMVLYAGLCVTSFPMLHCYRWGQVSLLLTACIMGAFLASSKNNRVLAGVLLAFAAAIKFYPAFFILYFILKRDVRTCAAFGLAAILFYLVFPAAVLGFSHWLEFERAVIKAIRDAQWVSQNINSQYVVHAGLRWFAIIFHRVAGNTAVRVLTIVSYVIALSSIVMVWVFQRRTSGEKHALSLVTIFLSIPFVIKTAWPHYFVYLPLCQAAVFSYYASSFRTLDLWGMVLAGLSLLSMMSSSVFIFNLFPSWYEYSSFALLFLANLLILVSVYAALVIKRDDCSMNQRLSAGTAEPLLLPGVQRPVP